ncbi:MAG: hypothetical protein KBT44_00325 [Bacteroidales bacterium]|nr:hypothetical protein [Candidatus Equibacterium intestinale]
MKRIIIALFIAALAHSAVVAQEPPKRYGIKSGIISRDMKHGQKSTFYFDDYGHKTAEINTAIMCVDGVHRDTVGTGTIMVDGQRYYVSYVWKTKRLIGHESEMVNFLNLTQDMVKEYGIKKVGTEEVCGRPCDIYFLHYKYIGLPVVETVWVWKGIFLKKETKSYGLYKTMETTDIQENVPVDPSVFIVPDFEEVQK